MANRVPCTSRRCKTLQPDIIGSPLVTQVKHDGHKKKKRKEDIQNIESDEEDSASEESGPELPIGGGGDEVNQEEGGEEGDKHEKGEVTPPKDPLTEAETSKKRKVSPQKPSARKKDPEPISLSQRMCSQWMMSISSSQPWRMIQRISYRDMKQRKKHCMKE
jgi:hypothetical protein